MVLSTVGGFCGIVVGRIVTHLVAVLAVWPIIVLPDVPILAVMFKHARIQDAAYQSLLRSTRQQYHGTCGSGSESDLSAS